MKESQRRRVSWKVREVPSSGQWWSAIPNAGEVLVGLQHRRWLIPSTSSGPIEMETQVVAQVSLGKAIAGFVLSDGFLCAVIFFPSHSDNMTMWKSPEFMDYNGSLSK
jgi:hypothetical protein